MISVSFSLMAGSTIVTRCLACVSTMIAMRTVNVFSGHDDYMNRWIAVVRDLTSFIVSSILHIPTVPRHVIDFGFRSTPPPYPDVVLKEGTMIEQGNMDQRKKCLERHSRALTRILELHKEEIESKGGGYIIVYGHGASHDFIPSVLLESFDESYHSPFCVKNCGVTTLAYNYEKSKWELVGLGE